MSVFAERLSLYEEELKGLRTRGASEDSVRDAFLRFLREAFPRLDQAEPILLEKHVPALRVRGGFADALFGDLIFEFKKRLDDRSRTDGKDELKRYLRNQKHPERYFGILSDGEAVEVYALREDELLKVDGLSLAGDKGDEAKLWLDCYLFHEKRLIPTANDVALRFGERSPTFWQSQRILKSLWHEAGSDAAAQTKFAEWQSLLSIVYGSAVGDEGLFLRHTYLALFARVLAFVALNRRAPADAELRGIVTGETFRGIGFENLAEEDFFTWIAEPEKFRQAGVLLHALGTRLTAAYDLGTIREDLLKELYQELVDPETRHDLGEFYTPDWLAELTLRQAGFPPPKGAGAVALTLLDPACGSGTFLFTAVRLVRESGRKGKALIDFCTRQLAGIDVHPLAVTIAKTNLFLALGDEARRERGPFVLPVYMADTLATVDRGATHPEIVIPVEVDQIAERSGKSRARGLPKAFGLPAGLAKKRDGLHALVDALIEFADPKLTPSDARGGLRERLTQLGVPESQWDQWDANLDLMRWLLEPPATNTVWRFILNNAYQPELLASRKSSFVVGNPPWLSYRYIKRRGYQDRVRQLSLAHGLLDKRNSHLFTQMDLATLFFAFCASRFLAEGGTLAFVMPRSILTGAKQHATFRDRYVAASSFLIDCEQVTPLFNVPACVVVAKREDMEAPKTPGRRRKSVAMLRLRGQLPSRNASLVEAEKHWEASETTHTPVAAAAGSPYWSEVTQGASLAPRCVWFVRTLEDAFFINVRRPWLETDPAIERQAKAPWKGIRIKGNVESDFLFATLLSDNMLPFGWRQWSMVVLPLVYDEHGGSRLVEPNAAVRMGKMGIYHWLDKAEHVWLEHRKSESKLLDWLNWQGKLVRQRPTGVLKLLFNKSGTHLCGCVVDARNVSKWRVHDLPVAGFIADYGTYYLEVATPEEAHYLCAVLNAPLVDKAIKPYQTKGAFGAQRGKGERDIHRRPFEVLPIPRFDKKNAQHRELARLSARCHKTVAAFLAQADEHWLTASIGRLRAALRADLLKTELDAIDEIVAAVLKSK